VTWQESQLHCERAFHNSAEAKLENSVKRLT